jgi:DnaJ-class molecular chaperone
MVINNRKRIMAIVWRKCFLCDGAGKLSILKSRLDFIEDKDENCPFCKGRGNIPIKKPAFKPWDKDDQWSE